MKTSFFQDRYCIFLESVMTFIVLALLVILVSGLRKESGEISSSIVSATAGRPWAARRTSDTFPFGTERPSSITFYYMEGDEVVKDYTVLFLYDGSGRLAAGEYERGINAGRISYLCSDGKLSRREDSLIYSSAKSCFVYGNDGQIIRYIEKYDPIKQLARGTVTEYFYDENRILKYAVRRTVMKTIDQYNIKPVLIVFQYGEEMNYPYEKSEGDSDLSDYIYRPGGRLRPCTDPTAL